MNEVEKTVENFRKALIEQDLIISEYYKRKEKIEKQKKGEK